MIGIFAYGLAEPRQLSIACAVVVAAYGPFCVLIHLAVSLSVSICISMNIHMTMCICRYIRICVYGYIYDHKYT